MAAAPRSLPSQLREQADVLYDLASQIEEGARATFQPHVVAEEIEQVSIDVRAIARGR